MGSITEIAQNTILKIGTMEDKYRDPEDVLDYLSDGSHFRTTENLLREFMVKAGICQESDDNKTMISELFCRYTSELGNDMKKPESEKKKIRRWFSEEGKFCDRETAITLCFALDLDADDANAFLNKCGYHSFNVRNAYDAIYLYCILNRRRLHDAKKLIQDYENADAPEVGTFQDAAVPEIPHGETTVILEQTLLGNSDWDSDESFMQTFLLPNKARFTSFSNTAEAEYYKLKNRVYWNMVILKITQETEDMSFTKRFLKANQKYHIQIDMEALPKEEKQHCLKLAEQIAKEQLPSQDPEVQKTLAAFLDAVMYSEENLIRNVLPALTNDDGRPRAYKTSGLGKTVLKYFPNGKTLRTLEKDPAALYRSGAGRKAIVLMCYLDFVYRWSSIRIDDPKFIWDTIEDPSYYAFLESTNAVLDKCRLPVLYPANQFDWLILYSVQQFAAYDLDEDDPTPVKAFQDVLEAAFPEPEED